MFLRKTVFILGAGASWHYGYPTGESLVRKIIVKASSAAQYFQRSQTQLEEIPLWVREQGPTSLRSASEAWIPALERCKELSRRLKEVNPLLIDYFLGLNPKLASIGRLITAWIILECEQTWMRGRRNQNHAYVENEADDWYRFVLHKLVSGCRKPDDLLSNKVSFITFNYDVSLEDALLDKLSSIQLFEESPNHIRDFVGNKRVIHVYGSVREPSTRRPENMSDFSETLHPDPDSSNSGKRRIWQRVLDTAYTASRSLRTIDPFDKSENADDLAQARRIIAEAECVFILGYGFDEANSERLGLFESLNVTSRKMSQGRKSILFTNMGNVNRVNKKASRIMFGTPDRFLPPNPPVDEGAIYYCEMSTRDVYGALELDFDSLEEQRS